MPWADVRKEMVEEKKLDPEVADKIGKGFRFALWPITVD